MGGVTAILSIGRDSFLLDHEGSELETQCDLLIMCGLRPPPRWAKWSRGVRTRGLRVGLVGGPRPLLFLGAVRSDEEIALENSLPFVALLAYLSTVLALPSSMTVNKRV